MAEDLIDGEFWLPADFLTDDDILTDIEPVTETESDEDDLTHRMNTHCAIYGPLSTSPQSTLCGFGKDGSGSSHDGSPNRPLSPPPPPPSGGGTTLELLRKAADEVARYKMDSERPKGVSCGTGFFDCSGGKKDESGKDDVKRQFCPPVFPLPLFSQPQFGPLSHKMRPQFNNGNQLIGMGPQVWPPHNRHMHVRPPIFVGPIGPKRESVGTGVFLPRRVSGPVDTRTKKQENNSMKMRSGKGSSQPQQQRKRNSKPQMGNPIEIQLPQEWVY